MNTSSLLRRAVASAGAVTASLALAVPPASAAQPTRDNNCEVVKRLVTLVFALALMAVVLVSPASATQAKPCSTGDAQIIANAGIQAVLERSGVTHGPGSTWGNCQFRFYDDNDEDDPEVPHVFSDTDYFIGAIAQFEFYDTFQRPDYDRAAAIAFLETVTNRVFFGPASTPDAALPELALTETHYRDGVFVETGEHVVIGYRYHIFTPGSLAPGEYKWRFEEAGPFGEGTNRGTIIIVDE